MDIWGARWACGRETCSAWGAFHSSCGGRRLYESNRVRETRGRLRLNERGRPLRPDSVAPELRTSIGCAKAVHGVGAHFAGGVGNCSLPGYAPTARWIALSPKARL